VFVNYPDPPVWEGSKQRLIDRSFLDALHRVLKPGGTMTLLTDDELYATQTQRLLGETGHM
jgi:tRNA G46 methylase TrmB